MPFMSDGLEDVLRREINRCQATPLAQLLLEQGLLQQWIRSHLLQLLCNSVIIPPEEHPSVLASLCNNLPGVSKEIDLSGDWLSQIDPAHQATLKQRWDQLRMQKWLEQYYGDQVEAHFLSRRANLEQVVYGAIRVSTPGLADELYLRLLEAEEPFGVLARRFSQGEERYTNGLVGPMTIDKPHPSVRQALEGLAVGDVHPPLHLGNWFIILCLEHRQPARLDDATRFMLLQDMFQADFEVYQEQCLSDLMPLLLQPLSLGLQQSASTTSEY